MDPRHSRQNLTHTTHAPMHPRIHATHATHEPTPHTQFSRLRGTISQITMSGRSLRYSRRSVGPRMQRRGTPALTGYSCEAFPSRTTWSRLLLRKEEIRSNIWPEIPSYLSLWRRPACQILSKALHISSVTARVASDLLKAIAILSDTTVRRSAVDRENLKPYFKR